MTQNDDADIKDGFNSLKIGSKDSAAAASYYDEWAATYDATLKEWDYQAPDDAAATLGEYLKVGDEILDVGCGTGMFAKALSRKLDCRVDGIDISLASLEIAEQQRIYHHLHHHDLQATPLPLSNNAFDAAACVGIMTYIAKASDLLADLCRIVRPGGYILFTQRDDRWAEKKFDSLINSFVERQLWTPLQISKPMPYMPKNDDYSDNVKVIHVLCQVV